MADDRLRIPQDPVYFHAIGLAAVAFARLEWDAVWCCERLKDGYINTIEPGRKTAGDIGKDLANLFARISDAELRARTVQLAIEFLAIVKDRNGLLHGKPGTAPNGDQRLFRHGTEWTIATLNLFSDRCVRAGMPLNALLYADFKEPCNVMLNQS